MENSHSHPVHLDMRTHYKLLKVLIVLLLTAQVTFGQSTIASKFDTLTMQFTGTKQEQARYLLRYVNKYARISDSLTVLPPFLDRALACDVAVPKRRRLQKYLDKKHMLPEEIGGGIDSGISNVRGIAARYFVIHDASNFLLNMDTFPVNIDSTSWSGNRIDNKRGFKYSHLFINRLGESMTSNNFSVAIHATKFESPIKNPLILTPITGDFIHIELVQPRLPDLGKKNDAIAVLPGFTQGQYDRLALVYLAASVRKGDWLVPAFHAVLDEGIYDGHDDPQHFELERFDAALALLVKTISH